MDRPRTPVAAAHGHAHSETQVHSLGWFFWPGNFPIGSSVPGLGLR